MDDLFTASAEAAVRQADDDPAALEVFEAGLLGQRRTDWRSLFQGYRRLRAITYSSSAPALLAVADLFEEMEVLFGSERVLSRELEALEPRTPAPRPISSRCPPPACGRPWPKRLGTAPAGRRRSASTTSIS